MQTVIEQLFPRDRLVRDPHRLFSIGLVVLTFLYLGYQIPSRLVFAITPSLKHRFFYLQRNIDIHSLKKGDYVVFDIRSDLIPNCTPCTLIKKIGCIPGDLLSSTTAGAYYCNGKFLGNAKIHSLEGKRLERFVFNGPVPKGSLFLVGSHRDSYDSRYFGFIERMRINGRAIPFSLSR